MQLKKLTKYKLYLAREKFKLRDVRIIYIEYFNLNVPNYVIH